MCGDGVVKVKGLQIADFSPRLVTLIGKFANLFGTHIAHGNTGVQFLTQLLIHLTNRFAGIAAAFEALFDVGQYALKSLNLRIRLTNVPQNIHREIGALGVAA